MGIQQNAGEVVLALHGRDRSSIGELLIFLQGELDRVVRDPNRGVGKARANEAESFRQGFHQPSERPIALGSDGNCSFPAGGHLSEENERSALCPEANRPPIAIGLATRRADATGIIAVKIALLKADYPLSPRRSVTVAGDSKYRAMTPLK